MKNLKNSILIFIFFTLLTGGIYPLVTTGIANALFPNKANGSLLSRNHVIIGSALIGQKFDSSVYFSSRPSAISYNPLPSGGSNLSLTNSELRKMVAGRRVHFIEYNKSGSKAVPDEMLFASASGLDPDISPGAAFQQVDRIASARNFNSFQKSALTRLVEDQIEKPSLFFGGEERVNVLLLNIELDKIK